MKGDYRAEDQAQDEAGESDEECRRSEKQTQPRYAGARFRRRGHHHSGKTRRDCRRIGVDAGLHERIRAAADRAGHEKQYERHDGEDEVEELA